MEGAMNDAGDGRMRRPHELAIEVTTAHGEILLDAPDGVAVALTPDAAAETGRRLIAAAREALSDRAG
jgi:hypothetical protein